MNQNSAQQLQDKIFRRMSASQKVKLGSDLWRLGKSLAPDKIIHSPAAFQKIHNGDTRSSTSSN